MGGTDSAPGRAAGRRRLLVGALVAWAVCAVVVWNVVFDAIVIDAGRDYLTRQALHQQGRGGPVTIRAVMDPGVARAARTASLSGAAVASAGLLVAWLAWRVRPGRSARRAE
jgi:hypothetical protein